MKWLFLSVFASILLSACKQNTENKYPRYQDFPEEKSLQGKVIPLDTALFRYPYRIKIIDSTAFIMDLHNADNYVHAFTYPGFKHRASFGKRGEGPEELIQINAMYITSYDSIWVIEGQKTKASRWSFSPATAEVRKIEEFQLSKDKLWVTDMVMADGNTFLIPDYSGSCSFYIENKEGIITDTIGALPTELHPVEPSRQTLGQVWTRFISYNPGNGRVALASQMGEVLEIYNLKDGSQIVTYGPNGEPIFKVAGKYAMSEGIMGFNNVYVGNKYIYAIFQGVTMKEIRQKIKDNIPRMQGGKQIYVFDLDGKPVRKYTLDHSISGFYLDEASGKLFGLDVNNDEPVIEYNL